MPEHIDADSGEIISVPIRNANQWTRVRVPTNPEGLSRAKQAMRDECDINIIMRKYEKGGLIDHVNKYQGQYGDFIGFEDYHASSNQILDAQAAFLTIPARIRAQFNNDPRYFLEFAQNPENLDELIKMGLAPARPSEPPEGDAGASPGPTPSPQPKPNPAPSTSEEISE